MAKSRRKNGSCTRGRFRLKKMGKGWSTVRKRRQSERVVLRITDAAPSEPVAVAAPAAAAPGAPAAEQPPAKTPAAKKPARKKPGTDS
jgi:hypothetical protein